jgi:acyl-CoA dehydrogenase
MNAAVLLEPFEAMLAKDGHDWDAIETSGFLDALVSEAQGGAGLSLSDIEPLLRALGRHNCTLQVAETIVARALPAGSSEALRAILAACAMAGAMERVLEISITYTGDRVQFGKPISKIQAVQHQLAVMAEHVVLARMASQLGCSQGLHPSTEIAAVAKQVTSASVPTITGMATAVHGAIGITQEYALAAYVRRLHELRVAHGSESYWARKLGAARLASPDLHTVDFVRAIQA